MRVNHETMRGRGFPVSYDVSLRQRLVLGVVSWLKLTGDVSDVSKTQIDLLVTQAYNVLVSNGFNPAKAKGIAEREVAQALGS